jgi:membrane-associated phospholipid phosphatase
MKNKFKQKIIILSCIFIIWTILVITNSLTLFDDKIYQFIIGFQNETLTSIMKIITSLANPLTIVSLCLISLLSLIWKYKASIYLIIITIISTVFNFLTKNIVLRSRPDHLRLIEETGYSFPSGHAMGSIAFYGFIIYLLSKSKINKNLKIFLSVIIGLTIFLIGISRIYVGVHYPSDVIGGFLLGYIILISSIEFLNKRGYIK